MVPEHLSLPLLAKSGFSFIFLDFCSYSPRYNVFYCIHVYDVLGLVHNMTLAPELCLKHLGDAEIELITIPASQA